MIAICVMCLEFSHIHVQCGWDMREEQRNELRRADQVLLFFQNLCYAAGDLD